MISVPRPARSASPISKPPLASLFQVQLSSLPAFLLVTVTASATKNAE